MNDQRVMYISVALIAVAAFIFAAITFGITQEITATEQHIAELEDVLENHEATANEVPEAPVVKDHDLEQVCSAVEVGNEVVALQDVLGELFCTDGNLPKDLVDLRLTEGPKIGKRLSELTGIEEDMYYYAAWKLHEDWSLELASVIEYKDVDEFPVLFTMLTEDGDLAGVVKATYDVEEEVFSQIEQHYPGVSYRHLTQELGDL